MPKCNSCEHCQCCCECEKINCERELCPRCDREECVCDEIEDNENIDGPCEIEEEPEIETEE